MDLKIDKKIFRAYDVRGIYPHQINKKTAYFLGRAFGRFLGPQKADVALGRDNRLSSPVLFRAVKKGLLQEGIRVFDIGLSTTPILYFSVAHFGYDGGIEVTASHLSGEWNGFKLVGKGAFPIGQKSGLKEIQQLIEKIKPSRKKGKVIKKKVLQEYIKFNFEDLNLELLKPLRVVIDTGNSVPGILIPFLKKNLPIIKIFSLFEKLDGNFPNHGTDPLIEENIASLKAEVKEKKAAFGVAFDGDGDRIVFVDEKGKRVPGDLILALVGQDILEEYPGARILYDIRSSNAVREVIKNAGGIPIISRIGHSFIKAKMRKEDILFGGEFSGHYYSKRHYFCEAPIFVLLKVLEIVSKKGTSLSQLIKPFKRYFHSGEINFPVKNKEKVLAVFEKKYKKGRISRLDGLRVDFNNWWFLLRPSNTEPLLRLVIEAKTRELFQKKKKELVSLIRQTERSN